MINKLDFDTAYRLAVTNKGNRLLPRNGAPEAIFDFTTNWYESYIKELEDDYENIQEKFNNITAQLRSIKKEN